MCVSQRDQGLGSSLRNERLAETIFPYSYFYLFVVLSGFFSFLKAK